MRKLVLTPLFALALVLCLAAPSTAVATQPKLDIKVFLGVGATTYVAMLETGRERNLFCSYQVGFGPRIRLGKAFFEAQVNSFELPLLAGYIPYKNP
jgi:hypothetical protein